MVIRGHYRCPQRIDRPGKGFGTQWGRHLCPVVVRVGRVQVGVGERLHKLRPEAVLEVGRRYRVHLVSFPLAPLGPPVLEPHLKRRGENGK